MARTGAGGASDPEVQCAEFGSARIGAYLSNRPLLRELGKPPRSRPASSAALTVIAPGRMMALARVHERFSLSVRKTHFRVVTPFSCFARFVSTRMPTLFFCIPGSKSGGRPVPRHTFLVRDAHPCSCK